MNEKVVEPDLRFRNGAGQTIELRHDHRQAERLLLVRLKIDPA